MKSLTTNTSNVEPRGSVEQIKIEYRYFFQKSPIFTIPTTRDTPNNDLEHLFNIGDISMALFQSIRSIDDVPENYSPIPAGAVDEKQLLYNIKLYVDYRSALFIQQLLSFVLLYPENLLYYAKLDDKTRRETIRTKSKAVRSDLFNYELEVVTDTILLLMNSLGKPVDEVGLKPLLNNIDLNRDFDWNKLSATASDVKGYIQLIELFQTFSNMMELILSLEFLQKLKLYQSSPK